MTDPEYPVTIAHGHPQGGLTATDDGHDDPRIAHMLRLGVVSTEAEALDLIGKCDAAGVSSYAVADVVGRWDARSEHKREAVETAIAHACARARSDMARISEQLQRTMLDLRAARRIQRRGWQKPARAGRRRSRQARSSRPRALRRAIARGLDPELAKREHWAHGGERHP